jgi:hypothetical protein
LGRRAGMLPAPRQSNLKVTGHTPALETFRHRGHWSWYGTKHSGTSIPPCLGTAGILPVSLGAAWPPLTCARARSSRRRPLLLPCQLILPVPYRGPYRERVVPLLGAHQTPAASGGPGRGNSTHRPGPGHPGVNAECLPKPSHPDHAAGPRATAAAIVPSQRPRHPHRRSAGRRRHRGRPRLGRSRPRRDAPGRCRRVGERPESRDFLRRWRESIQHHDVLASEDG